MRSDREPAPARDRLPFRATDRVEDTVAWLLTVAALVVLVVAGITGFVVHQQRIERAAVETATRWPTSAVLLEDAVVLSGSNGERYPVQVDASWTDRKGVEHTGTIATSTSVSAGTVVEAWTDADGRIVGVPTQPAAVAVLGAVAAGGVLAVGGALLYGLWIVVRSLTGAANDRRWEREWAQVEPEWRSRHFR